MKVVIAGGSGLIGKKVVKLLRDGGHDALPASPSTGVNCLTGEGVADAMKGRDVVVDVTNSPSFEDSAVMNFYQTSTTNLLRSAAEAGVRHFVALSVVGADRAPDSGYMRAKVNQESLIKAGKVPYTIVRATQFFEFAGAIGGSAVDPASGAIRLPPALMQPIAADDVAALLAAIAVAPPANGVVEIAGPEKIPMDQLVRRFLGATKDTREVKTDPDARYFGAHVDDRSLTPGDKPRLGPTRYEGWLSRQGK